MSYVRCLELKYGEYVADRSVISFEKTFLFTTLALTAFAANSVLCRLSLCEQLLDASSFTIVRLFSGWVALFGIVKFVTRQRRSVRKSNWAGPAMLFVFATTFSFAYIILDTGTGALILSGSVQLTIVLISLFSGDKLNALEWTGFLAAVAGFVYLVLPGVKAPSFTGFVLMTAAGIAWGAYTLMGRTSQNPLPDTTVNFARTLPFVVCLGLFAVANESVILTPKGLLLAAASGSITSGVGYAVWYKALAGLSAPQSGVVQLFVPVIAALGGLIFASEAISTRLFLSAIMILGGIALVFFGRYQLSRFLHVR